MDDVFDDEGEECLVAQKDWNRTENDIRKTGYRMGVSVGQEETLQQGFDDAYFHATVAAFNVGRFQGQISASLSLVENGVSGLNGGDAADRERLSTELRKVLDDFRELEQSIYHSLLGHLSSMSCDQRATTVSPLPAQSVGTVCETAQTTLQRAGGDDDVREITNRLSGVGLQGVQQLPPMSNAVLNETWTKLVQRYQSLTLDTV